MRSVSVSEVVPRDLPTVTKGFALTNYARLWIPEIVDAPDVLYCDSDFCFVLDPR